MTTLLIYGLLAMITLALPLYIYKHPFWIIGLGCISETMCIGLIYGSTFILCTDKSACGSDWAASVIPLLIMAMNLGMIWPILAAYAKQAKKDAAEAGEVKLETEIK